MLCLGIRSRNLPNLNTFDPCCIRLSLQPFRVLSSTSLSQAFMDGNRVVHDISSDEDVAFDFAATEGRDNDIDWKDLFVNLESGDAGNNQNCDKGYDSDDVVVVAEVLAKPKKANKFSAVAKVVAQDLQDDDDDCVVLDGDPDKPAAVEDSGPDSGGDSDDLVVVAEKGQVACRDYPHPRHLCVKFPFDSTQHSDHCTICHCYVCDSPAPCGLWGNGNLLIDHCHANDKEELWKSERKRAKLEKTACSVVSSTDTSFWRDLLKQIPAPPPQFGSHARFPGQAPSSGMPNIIRSQRSAGFSGRPGFQSNLPSQQQINPCSNIRQWARGTALAYSTPTTIFKRTGQPLGRGSVPNRASNNSYNNFRHAYANNLIGIHRATMQVNARHSNTFQSSSAIRASHITSAPVPPRDQVQLQQYSQPHLHQNGNVSTPLNSTTQSNTSEPSQALAGVSHFEAGQPLPLTEEKSGNGMNLDFPSLELDTFFNDIPDFDFEGDHLLYDIDPLWPPV